MFVAWRLQQDLPLNQSIPRPEHVAHIFGSTKTCSPSNYFSKTDLRVYDANEAFCWHWSVARHFRGGPPTWLTQEVQESAEVARNVMRLELVYEVGLVDAFSFVLCVCVCVFLLLFDVLTFAKFKTGVESRFETLEHLNFLVGGYASPRGLREAEVANIVRRCHRTAKWPPKATCGGFWRGAHRRGAARVRGVGGVWCCV